jgi:hypothetical protein
VGAVPDTDRQTQHELPESAVTDIESAPASVPIRIRARRDVRALTAAAVLGLQRSAGNQAVMRAMTRPLLDWAIHENRPRARAYLSNAA